MFIAYHGAAVTQVWVNRYSLVSDRTNQATTMALAPDGNIIVAGSSANTNGDLDYLIIKYAPSGAQTWLVRYDSPTNGSDLLRGMTVDKAGSVVLTGTSKTAKFDTNGNLLWNAPYGGRAMASGTNSDVYVTGFSETDFATAKLTGAMGSNVWTRIYDKIGQTDISQVICADSDENVYIAGFETWMCDRTGCYQRARIFKYNFNGTTLWQTNMFAASGYQTIARGITSDQPGNIYVLADSPGWLSYATDKLNSNGDRLWEWSLDLDGGYNYTGPESRAIAVSGNGEVYLTGTRLITGDEVCYTLKLTNGHKAWLTQYHGPGIGENKGTAIALDSAGNIYVTGNSIGTNSGLDIFTVKYDNNGNQLWVQRYDGPAHSDDIATGIVVDNETNVYVTGYSATTNGGTEFVTIKYSQKPALNIEKQPNGSMRLKVFADPGQLWGFQTTTNVLTNWQTIGTNTTNTNGVAELDDTNTPPFPPRFYRGVSPPLP